MPRRRGNRTFAKMSLLALALGVFGGAAYLNFREAEARRDLRSPFEDKAEAQLNEFLSHQADPEYQRNLAEALVRHRAAKGDKNYSLQDAHAMLKVFRDSLNRAKGFEAAKERLALCLKAKQRDSEKDASLRAAKADRPPTTFAEAIEEMALRAEVSR